jgi:NAD(P)-dependent dehydrogenase (short-subunit alcohol dehydrogenase family)
MGGFPDSAEAAIGATLQARTAGAHHMSDLFSLEGRTALVTGGSRGIGRMIAAGFLKAGARVFISSRKAAACNAAAAELSALGPCTSLPADVSTMAGIQGLAAALAGHTGHLDILVNNAGAAWGAPFDDFPEHGWDKVVDLNLKSPFFLTQALHGALRAGAVRGHCAKVIHVASIDGVSVNPMETYSYAASKAGLIHLTRRMALRLVQDGIVVSAIAPGAFASDMNRDARDRTDEVARRVPAGRIGCDDDMAGAAIYLASRAGDYVVGATLVVDGGVTFARG